MRGGGLNNKESGENIDIGKYIDIILFDDLTLVFSPGKLLSRLSWFHVSIFPALVSPRARLLTADSTGSTVISSQTSGRGTSMIPSVGTSVANEAFEYIFGDNSQTALVFQSPTIPNDGQPSTSLNWGLPESTYASQMPPSRC